MKAGTKLGFRKSIVTAVFAVLACFAGFLDRGMSPFSMAEIFIMLCACICGGIQGAGAAGIFMLCGVAGLSVFPEISGGKGFLCLTGNYGGFIFGLFIAAVAAGFTAGSPFKSEKKIRPVPLIRVFAACFIAYFILFVAGSLWYYHVTEEPCFKIFIKSYILSEGVKFFITLVISLVLRPVAADFLYPEKLVEQQGDELIQSLKNKVSGD